MPRYLDTRGNSKIAIGICARCNRKFPYDELISDPNFPGLFVCSEDVDEFDPWRLPPRETENITLQHPRPDVSLEVGPQVVAINPIESELGTELGISLTDDFGTPVLFDQPANPLIPSVPWTTNTNYTPGMQVTPINPVGSNAVGIEIYIFTCIQHGTSGQLPPNWLNNIGAEIVDNDVIWLNTGLYLP